MAEQAPRVAVVQDGARRNYAVPLALQRAGALERMFTEFYVKPGSLASVAASVAGKIRPKLGKRLGQRVHREIEPSRVFTNLPLVFRQSRARKRFPTVEDFHAWSSDRAGDWIIGEGFGRANALFGFVRNVSPDVCRVARERRLAVIADQFIAPMAEEYRQTVLQYERFPEWQESAPPCNPKVVERIESQTWAHAHEIVCGSDYVRDSLVAQGVLADRITVLPFPIDVERFVFVDRRNRTGPVTVGVVGTVQLRKGSQYVVQVADRLPSVRFSLVGPVWVDRKLLEGRANLELVGAVSRAEVAARLKAFDILLFPSTCEGSPGAVMEAMSTGLPVVTAPTAGTAVRHEVDGFVHAYDDIDAMANSIERLASDAALRHDMGQSARRRAESFSLAGFGEGLLNVVRRALADEFDTSALQAAR